jgi:glycosyltransferase involved in cell wall biosynthesis
MKVIHLPLEIAGQMGALCGAIKRHGHQAIGYNYFHTFLSYTDNILPADGYEITNIIGDAIQHFDVFHFHYMLTPLYDYSDLAMIAEAGKPIVMHHWGSDVRKASISNLLNPYVNTDPSSEEQIHEKLLAVSKYVSTAIVQDYEVIPYVSPYYKEVHVLPVAIDISKFAPAYPNPYKRNPLVLHAPTQPQFKGTDIIERAISQLQNEIPFQYQRVENMSHEAAKQLYRQADIIIDQILNGSYGLFCAESMALGKPVITFVRDDLLCQYTEELPICNANPDTIYHVLKTLLQSGELRYQKGMEARSYAERHHDSNIVGAQLIKIYDQLLQRKASIIPG